MTYRFNLLKRKVRAL